MRDRRISLLCIALGIICILLFLGWQFRAEIFAFLRSLKLYIAISSPIFFIMGIYLFQDDKWSVISTLSLVCLIVFAFTAYYVFLEIATPSTSAVSDVTKGPYWIRILIAELAIIVLMTVNVIKYYRQRKRMEEVPEKSDESDEDEEGWIDVSKT